MEYYESRLNDSERKFYRDVYDCLSKRGNSVMAPVGMTREALLKCLEAVQFDHPELFYVEFQNINYFENCKDKTCVEYCPAYLYDEQETDEKWREISRRVKRIVDAVNAKAGDSIYQKCGWIHNYLVRNCPYNYDAIDHVDEKRPAYTIEGVFLEKTAVCQGIALAYRLLSQRLGVDTIVVSGRSLRPGNKNYEKHAWNMIHIGEEYAHLDATWDGCVTNETDKIRYDYFFLPDIEMMRDHQYVGYPICRKIRASYFEKRQTLFTNMQELEEYIKRECQAYQLKGNESELYLHFKMKNSGVAQEDIQAFVVERVQHYMERGLRYRIGNNKPQSVFECYMEIL